MTKRARVPAPYISYDARVRPGTQLFIPVTYWDGKYNRAAFAGINLSEVTSFCAGAIAHNGLLRSARLWEKGSWGHGIPPFSYMSRNRAVITTAHVIANMAGDDEPWLNLNRYFEVKSVSAATAKRYLLYSLACAVAQDMEDEYRATSVILPDAKGLVLDQLGLEFKRMTRATDPMPWTVPSCKIQHNASGLYYNPNSGANVRVHTVVVDTGEHRDRGGDDYYYDDDENDDCRIFPVRDMTTAREKYHARVSDNLETVKLSPTMTYEYDWNVE